MFINGLFESNSYCFFVFVITVSPNATFAIVIISIIKQSKQGKHEVASNTRHFSKRIFSRAQVQLATVEESNSQSLV